MSLAKLRCLAILAILAVTGSAAFASESDSDKQQNSLPDETEIRVFDVLRDGSSIGRHQLTIHRDGDTTEVQIDVLLEVGLGPIVLYRYEQENREIWRDGRFVSFHSKTNNDVYGVMIWKSSDSATISSLINEPLPC